MSSVIASRRYAYAFLSAAEAGGFLETVTGEMQMVGETLAASRDLQRALASPLINADRKTHLLEEIFAEAVGDKMMLFLRLIAHKKRAGILGGITQEFAALLDEKNGIVNAAVTSATELSESQQKALSRSLDGYTGKKVRSAMKIDESLIGGLSVKIGDTIFDGSVRHQLQLLREKLVAVEA
ncbi:F0F1 ATP synthase subunit delta [Chlorobium phaeovibrioides]|uniref:ATP synthase F1 subunit delta n=1 Tax=Chlorobium phaeovibrioides TaxID=1094 RepID=UPI000F81904A|nr:ATP synthase F1 subunit delta [Chlorobium phaeovibrioides]RTY36679.1 F0F1 ATP synthase subunit delta [Chlorobium phaeovibrioides]